jgi:DNA-binding transcriptional MerR regulator
MVGGVRPELLTIGSLARSSGLTVKAIRYYDRVGLLTPEYVDDTTGFRYFSPAQVEVARLIRQLRAIDVPMDDVRICVSEGSDSRVVKRVLLSHQRRLESRSTKIAGDLHRLMPCWPMPPTMIAHLTSPPQARRGPGRRAQPGHQMITPRRHQ